MEKVQKQKALLRIIATLIGVKYDDLWQRHGRREQRKRRILAAAALEHRHDDGERGPLLRSGRRAAEPAALGPCEERGDGGGGGKGGGGDGGGGEGGGRHSRATGWGQSGN